MTTPPRRGPGRPRGQGVVDPDDILDATLQAIASSGYDGLSVRSIARSLGVSQATVQHHFGTKAQLWEAAVDHLFTTAKLHQRDAEEQDLALRILNALDASQLYPGALHALLADRAAGHVERLSIVADRYRTIVETGTELIRTRQGQGLAEPFDPEALLLLITVGIGAIASAPAGVQKIFGYDITDSGDATRLAHALTQLIGNGVYPRS